MRLTMLGKFPPIPGNVASRAYWLTRGFAERGIETSVVTNSLATEERCRLGDTDFKNQKTQEALGKNVRVYSISDAAPPHAPYSQGLVTRLVNLGLKAIGERGSDLIFVNYLEPYAVAGFLLAKLTGIPLVIAHGNSDVMRILPHDDYALLLGRILARADGVISTRRIISIVQRLGGRAFEHPDFAIHPEFAPDGPVLNLNARGVNLPSSVPLIACMGKFEKHGGAAELLEALRAVRTEFRLVILSDVPFEEHLVRERTEHPAVAEKIIRMAYVPPWEMPALLRKISLYIDLAYRLPLAPHLPQAPFESLATGTPIFVSEEVRNKVAQVLGNAAVDIVSVADPRNTPALTNALEGILSNLPREQKVTEEIRQALTMRMDWTHHVNAYLAIFNHHARRWSRPATWF